MFKRKKASASKKSTAKKKPTSKKSQSSEAKALLAKMEEKSDAGDCEFC